MTGQGSGEEQRKIAPEEREEPLPAPEVLEREHRLLAETWSVPRGFVGWFMVADHRTIGIRYLITAFVFFTIAGCLAALIRLQLAFPDSRVLGPDQYNQIFTTHGLAMMFLFAVPVMDALGIYLVPLMVGTRNIAFPRLSAFSYYMFLFGGVRLCAALRPGVFGREANGRVQPVDHVHRAGGLSRCRRTRRDHLQAACPWDDAESHAAVRLGDAGHIVHGDLRHAVDRVEQYVPAARSSGRHALLQPG
jgi:hypothetical protein